jgi:hypothetical protein
MMFYFRDLIYDVVSGVVFLHTIAVGFHEFLCKKSKGCIIMEKGGDIFFVNKLVGTKFDVMLI